LTAFVSAIIDVDDISGTDSQSSNSGDMKKLTIALIAHRLSEHAPYICARLSV
jgi:hypothetical protein